MSPTEYRPWGLAAWVFGKIKVTPWSFLGCIGTEERSLAVWDHLIKPQGVTKAGMLRISDLASRHSARCNELLGVRSAAYLAASGRSEGIADHRINDPLHGIKASLDSFLAGAGTNIVLDVTSLPKRFFFPIIKFLLRRSPDELANLVVTYSVPAEYTKERLAENVDEWECIPMFGGTRSRDSAELLVVAVGFEGLGLHEHFDLGTSGHPIKLLLPFPASPPAFKRSWDLLRRLCKLRNDDLFETHRVDSKDVGDTFNRIVALSHNKTKSVDLAPFGPKPTSLGMCLFAAQTDSRVYYTQPGVYHPDYSKGLSQLNGAPEIYAYCLRLGGRDLYKI